MPIINRRKISGVKPMLLQYFNDNSPVKVDFLREKVDADTIKIAEQEHFIQLCGNEYRITSKGREYRNN